MMPHLRFKQFLPGLAMYVLALTMLQGCTTSKTGPQSNRYQPPSELTEEISLAEDRSELANLREKVPPAVRKENDELAFYLKMMETETKPPYRIRSRFNTLYNRKRNRFRKLMQRERARFNKAETRLKEDFLKQMKRDRDEFYEGKPPRDRIKDFSRDQDEERRRFFANQRERRRDFSDQMRQMQRDFDQNMRDLRSDFNQAYREYNRRYKDRKKREKLDKISPPPAASDNSYTEQFKAMENKQRELLKAGEEGN